jgi:hypothetical protein
VRLHDAPAAIRVGGLSLSCNVLVLGVFSVGARSLPVELFVLN